MKALGFMLATVICAALVAAGCGGSDEPSPREIEAKREAAEDRREAALGAKPKIPQGPTSKKLFFKDLKEGTGPPARRGDTLIVHYVAGVYETGDEIESGWVEGSPFGFRLGAGGMIPGWEVGLRGVRAGARRELVFPTTPKHFPPGSELGDTLVYVVDVIGVRKAS